MKCTFTAKGHRNILASHKRTLEFTKDKQMSLDGDCIAGVDADFSLPALQRLVRRHRHLRMRIRAGGLVDEIDFIANKRFSSSREVVLRFSEFSSDRTLGFRATKSASMLNKQLRDKLRVQGQQITVEIEPLFKAVLFDFDDTIEDFKAAKVYAHAKVAKRMLESYGVYEQTTIKLLQDIDKKFSVKGVHSKPLLYDRHLWFKDYFKNIGVEVSKADIDGFVNLYWRFIIEGAKPMPNAQRVLRELKKEYKTAVMSDSDGIKRFKVERAKTCGLFSLIDLFLTSDDVGVNKPAIKFYSRIFEKLGVRAEECVMVGDKPQVDLKLAKELGMKTVWMKHGDWAKRQGKNHFDYVDYSIRDLDQLLKIMKEL
jgi:putative hydrolase of the HAD superfamily